MANDLKDYWTRRMAEQGKAVDGTPLPATQQPAQTPQAAPTQADTAPASNNPLYNYWSKRMAEQGRTAEGSPLTSNLTVAPGTEANTTPSDIGTIRNWYTGVNTDLTTINNYASSGQYDADLNQEYLEKLRNYNTELDGYIESASSQGYNKDANTMQNTKNGVDALIKQLEDSANNQTRAIDTSIQKTLGSAADYSQQVSDLESQIAELERTNHRGVIRQDTDAVSGELYDVYGNVNDEALHQLREQLQNANANKVAAERAERRERLRDNPNFEQYSSSITPLAENDTAIRALGGESIDAISGETAQDQSVKDLLGYATKDEEQMFNYILARQGEDAAEEYLDDLRYDLNARQASEKSQAASQYADEHGILASGKSIGQNLISGVGLLDTAIQKASAKKNNRRIDYNTWANQQTQQVQATRQTVAEDLVENHPNFKFDLLGREVNLGDVYQLGMSMLDSGATAALGAATGGGGWTAALLGASAGSQTTQEAVRNGASDSEALALGFAAMVAETATEKFSIDGLLEGTGKTWFTNMLKQAGVEASEEAASTILNNIADEAIRGENSDYNRRIRELEQNGMSHEEASNQAWKEFGQQIMFDAIGGAVSGGIMGGMFRGVRNNTDTQTQQNTEQAETVQNSSTDQTSEAETNNVSTETTPLAAEGEQTPSAPTVSENTENPQGPQPFDAGQVARDVWNQQIQRAQQNGVNTTSQTEAQQAETNNPGPEAEPQNANATSETPQTKTQPTSSTDISYRLNPRTNAEAVTKYGILDPGEIPARESNVPARSADNTNVSKSARTIYEAEAIPERRLSSVSTAIQDGKFDYITVKQGGLVEKATAKIREQGFDTALRNWTADVRAGKVNEDLVAEGAILLNNIANSDLDGKTFIDVATDYEMLTHNSAEGLAAARILKRLSPEGKLYGLQKTVNNYNEQLGENGNIKINEELAEKFLNEKTDKGRDAVIGEIQQDIADQIPSNFRDAFTALRYVNMLGNFKTQGRNITGNLIMLGSSKVKRSHQAVMTAVYNALGGKAEKNTSFFVDKALKKEAMADYAEHQSEALGEKKYADVARQNNAEIEDKRTIFKWNWEGEAPTQAKQALRNFANLPMKGLEAYRKATNWAMEQGDIIFSRATYADAMAGYLQAHGVKSFSDASAEMLDNARNYAIKEAQEATFRDTNKISEWATTFDSNWGKAKVLSQGIVPFRKTPANVGVRAVEYSPANALIQGGKAIYNYIKGNPQASSEDIINALSKSMTGTEIFALGVAGALAGWARGKNDDKEEEYYEKMNGAQDYAVKLPIGDNGYWISLSQFAPMSIPFFMGSEFVEAMQDGGLRGDNIMNILGSISAPMLEMSMLSGINDALDNLSNYNNTTASMPQFVLNSAMSYLTQAFSNTLLGQMEQASEKYRQQSYTDSDSALPTGIQKVVGKVAAKTPGWDYQQGDYINAWGEKQDNGETGERIFNAFFNPTYGAKDTTDELDKALYELNDELKELGNNTNVFPDTVFRGADIDGTKLTEAEYQRYATERGQLSHDLVEEFVNSPYWDELSAEEKANTIRDLYSYSKDRADQNIRASRGTIEVGKSNLDKIATALDNNVEDIVGYLALKGTFSDREKVRDYSAIDSLLSTVDTTKNEDGTYSDPEVQQMASDSTFSRYLSAYANGTSAELVGSVLDNIEAVNNLLPDADSADEGSKMRIVFETLSRKGADVQDFKNILDTYKKSQISQAKLNWLVKNYFPDDVETQKELYDVFRDYKLTKGSWKTPFERVKDSTEPENLMP